MSGFPLYDNLSKDLSAKKDLTVKQKTDLIKNINLIDQDGQELVYALIYYYYINNESNNESNNKSNNEFNNESNTPPYKGKSQETPSNLQNITWNLGNFPIKLRVLLHNFLTMHMKKLAEDDKREESVI